MLPNEDIFVWNRSRCFHGCPWSRRTLAIEEPKMGAAPRNDHSEGDKAIHHTSAALGLLFSFFLYSKSRRVRHLVHLASTLNLLSIQNVCL